MPDPLDLLSMLLRVGGFVCLFQAAGGAAFAPLAALHSPRSLPLIGTRIRRHAGLGMLLVLAYGLLEPARLAGELAGLTDPQLLQLALFSAPGAACLLRISGLALLRASAARPGSAHQVLTFAGIALALVSFLVIGHTTTHPQRILLAVLLGVHLVAVGFWLGALGPLCQLLEHERAPVAGAVLADFSRLATLLVPVLLLAGLGMAAALIPGLTPLAPAPTTPGPPLATPYSRLLLTKLALFVSLLLLASLNKWRLAPAVARGELRAVGQLRRMIRMEQGILVLVLAVTVVMTSAFSPQG